VTLDVGTDNEELRRDSLYIGVPKRRLRGQAYDSLVDEFVEAVQDAFPRAVLQLEDFGNANAFRLLEHYRERTCCFDDDIQGTGAVVLAGIYSSLRISGGALADQRFLFLGAGEAGIGIADNIVAALVNEGVAEAEARERCWFVDSKGLVVRSRTDLVEHKRPYAHDHEFLPNLAEAVERLRPTALIGVSGTPNTFTREILETLARQCERPMVFALSNPTSKAECTAKQAYAWTDGRAIFASGSPFAPVDYGGKTFVPGQGNNAYIFPGVGLGVIASEASRVTDEMFFASARSLADQVTDGDLKLGRVYPPLASIREVSAAIATAVAEVAYQRGLARRPRPDDLGAAIRAEMFEPDYPSYL
jgi:malate dehydrogenase (oxaloacetate-decarboxylating)(NADP+)